MALHPASGPNPLSVLDDIRAWILFVSGLVGKVVHGQWRRRHARRSSLRITPHTASRYRKISDEHDGTVIRVFLSLRVDNVRHWWMLRRPALTIGELVPPKAIEITDCGSMGRQPIESGENIDGLSIHFTAKVRPGLADGETLDETFSFVDNYRAPTKRSGKARRRRPRRGKVRLVLDDTINTRGEVEEPKVHRKKREEDSETESDD